MKIKRRILLLLANLKPFELNIKHYKSFTNNYCQANFPILAEYMKPVSKNAELTMIHIVTRQVDSEGIQFNGKEAMELDDYNLNKNKVQTEKWFWDVDSINKEDYEKELKSKKIRGRI
ncbi:hypothetical protein U3516DRAFT_761204 [Neocallimastix sp. 'constans']